MAQNSTQSTITQVVQPVASINLTATSFPTAAITAVAQPVSTIS